MFPLIVKSGCHFNSYDHVAILFSLLFFSYRLKSLLGLKFGKFEVFAEVRINLAIASKIAATVD